MGVLKLFLGMWFIFGGVAFAETSLLNVSYDPTRELYQDYNRLFADYWRVQSGQLLVINQSHGGSGKQARSVIDGLQADVVTLALAYDIDEISRIGKLLPPDWQARLPYNSAPYTSTIVFLVRKGNPKGIFDWGDLVKSGISVVTPNPKTSGGARWNYLAAWGYAFEHFNKDETQVVNFMRALFGNVPVLDTGARGSTMTFAQRGIGDVLLAWENEALLAQRELGDDKFEIVMPSVSILAEPSVAWVDSIVAKHKTLDIAKAYLEHLYSEEAQRLIAKHYFRPRMASVQAEYRKQFPDIRMLSIERDFGGWGKAQSVHFADGGIFDQLYH